MNQGSFQKGYLRINAYEYKKKENLKVLLFCEFKMKENWKTEENLNWEMKNIPQREVGPPGSQSGLWQQGDPQRKTIKLNNKKKDEYFFAPDPQGCHEYHGYHGGCEEE
jgi:hypothetical protein